MRTKQFFTAAALLLLLAAQAQKGETLTNKTVVALYKAGLGTETILAKIATSAAKFDVSTTGMIALKKQKLPDDIINAMVKKGGGPEGESIGVATKPTENAKPQTGKPTATPDLEFINVPHYLEKPANKLAALERSTVAVKAKLTFGSFVGGSTPIVFKMDSAKSPVRMPVQETVSFLVNTGANVPEIFGLYKMKSGKKNREATWFNVSAFENKSDKDVVAFNYKKVKDGVYEVVPISKLEKGEYCFVNKASVRYVRRRQSRCICLWCGRMSHCPENKIQLQ